MEATIIAYCAYDTLCAFEAAFTEESRSAGGENVMLEAKVARMVGVGRWRTDVSGGGILMDVQRCLRRR